MSINNQNTNGIAIDKEKFKKVSKKLHSALKKIDHTALKLTEVQEIFANSLGFRNVFEFQQRILNEDKEKTLINKKVGISLVKNLTTVQQEKFLNFIYKYNNKKNINETNEKNKINYIIYALNYIKNYSDKKAIPENLIPFLDYDFSYKTMCLLSNYTEFKTSLDFILQYTNNNKIIHFIYDYQFINKNYYLEDNNSYLEYLSPFEFFDNHNFEIYNKSWFSSYSEFDYRAIAEIRNIPDFYLSWLEIPIYKQLIDILIEQDIHSFSMTDLAVYIIKIIDPHKKELLIQLLDILVEEHEFVKSFTFDINNIMKRKNSVSLFNDGNI